jgi:DNA-binding GntR family transcriptional regulator
VFDGSLRSGERIPQDEIAQALGVSITPVREALIALQVEGIVRIIPHRGAFISPVYAKDIREQYALIGLLWAHGIRLALTEALAADRDDLAFLMRSSLEVGTSDELFDVMTRFTQRIEHLGGSSAWRNLIDAVPRLLPNTALYYRQITKSTAAVTAYAEGLALAIEQGEIEAATRMIEEMMLAHGAALIDELNERGLLAEP